ncbi:helicase associated domain-containing protein, partial [Paracoccaceae bacterium]|nr:helicase associated domain-containing protein [Paracoccaceae bacterium]
GFSWDPLTEQWEEGLNKLKQFYKREGHCLVVKTYKEDGYKLGQWVNSLRTKRDILNPEQIEKLDLLGFVWSVHQEAWEEGFNKLLQFHEREGNCLVPAKHIEDGYKLGTWVGKQRDRKDKLSENRIKKLDALGFVWAVKK